MSLMKEIVGRVTWSEAIGRVGRSIQADIEELRAGELEHKEKFLRDAKMELMANDAAGRLLVKGFGREEVAEIIEGRFPYAMIPDYLRANDSYGYIAFFEV